MSISPLFTPSRRGLLRSMIGGSMLLPGMVSQLLAEDTATADPLAPKPTHFPAKARNVIFLYMSGGVSHVDSFDPKPKLFADHGKSVTLDHPETKGRAGYEKLFLKRPGWKFSKHGKSGIEASSLFPHIGAIADDICIVRGGSWGSTANADLACDITNNTKTRNTTSDRIGFRCCADP